MISGYNTDIEYNAVVYHVQTEDKGFETPLILSLVYTGGEILAAKRSPYDDLIAEGFDEIVLAERLQRQHRLICAAIKQGRIEDLKRMSSGNVAREAAAAKFKENLVKPHQENYPIALDASLEQLDLEPLFDVPFALVQSQKADFGEIPEPPMDVENLDLTVPVPPLRVLSFAEPAKLDFEEPTKTIFEKPAKAIFEEPAQPSFEEPVKSNDYQDSPIAEIPPDALIVDLLEDREFYGGDQVELAVQVKQSQNGDIKTIAGANVMIKVLGSAFRPIILQTKTASNGLTVASFEIPHFKTGRGAILVRATYGGYEAELRRIISYG